MKKNKFSLDNNESLEINKQDLDMFIKGSHTHSTKLETPINDWRDEDKYAAPDITSTLRLNKYESGLVKEAAKKEVMSVNSLIRKILLNALEDNDKSS